MANSTRILFVSGEVAPFAKLTEVGQLARTLPEKLQDTGDYETRIMMPRYGTISERRNRLHEVIRLSGTEVSVGEDTEVLKVKVASIPGVRLQVYFMDNAKYFKRKGIYADKQGQPFTDNAERAIFFGRATLETIKKLGWKPDLVHAFGWMSAPIPALLRTEYAEDELFAQSKVVFTPNDVEVDGLITSDLAEKMDLASEPGLVDQPFEQVGARYADVVLYPPNLAPEGDEPQLADDEDARLDQLTALYEQVLGSVPA